jgi:glycosyltransferase involved in cell wall biosynthesis
MDNDGVISVCYVLSYYFPSYVRTSVLVEALKRMEKVVLYQAINNSTGIFRYFQTVYKLFLVRIFRNPDYYILGFRGYEIYWVVRIIAFGKPLVLDHLMSPYASLLYEKKSIRQGGIIDKLLYIYERSTLQCSEAVLTDTNAHRAYFSQLFQIDPEKIHAVHVGTDEKLFKSLPRGKSTSEKVFTVFFYGSFLLLHGVDIMLKAASMLQDNPIQFLIVGGKGKSLTSFREQVETLDLRNVVHREWVDYEKLPDLIFEADLCLGGPFGNTGQARRVITGKTFQFLAMGKPTVVGEIDTDHGFEDKKNCILVNQGDPKALASAITWAFDHKHKLAEIGQKGQELYTRSYSIDVIKSRLRTTLQL